MGQYVIKKVNYKKGKVSIVYEIPPDNKEEFENDEYSMSCKQEPLPSFIEAMEALAPEVAKICELDEVDAQKLTVSGVSFSYGGEDGVMGAVITAQKALKNTSAPLCLNTPHKPSALYGEDGDLANLLDSTTVLKLEDLQAEAERYIKGERQPRKLKDTSAPLFESGQQ